MSGHSKWATIHRAKGVKDAARGKLFSKLARLITIAAKTGGGVNPESNFKLRDVIEKARDANMPKDNIDRAISKASSSEHNLEEVTYEGFGPNGILVIVDAATDNRNRTGQEVKNLLERAGGRLGGPGSVSFQFTPTGFLSVKKTPSVEAQTLSLIDLGVEDIEEEQDTLSCFVKPHDLYTIRSRVTNANFEVLASELTMRPITTQTISVENCEKMLKFLESLEEHEDVQKIHTNAEFPHIV